MPHCYSFSCIGTNAGFYADLETNCQVSSHSFNLFLFALQFASFLPAVITEYYGWWMWGFSNTKITIVETLILWLTHKGILSPGVSLLSFWWPSRQFLVFKRNNIQPKGMKWFNQEKQTLCYQIKIQFSWSSSPLCCLQVFTCDWWYNVNCAASEDNYDLNTNLYKVSCNLLEDRFLVRS